jgi:HEAT repeat protein
MDDGNPKVRSAAVAAISSFTPPTPEILDALAKAVKNEDIRVRMTAIGSLRRFGYVYPDKVVEILKTALDQEKDDQTRKALSSALEKITPPPAKAAAPVPAQPAKQESKPHG